MAREEIEVEVTKKQLELLKKCDTAGKIIAITDDVANIYANDIKIGYKDTADSELVTGNIKIGNNATSHGDNSIVIGNTSQTSDLSIVLGHNAETRYQNSIQIGTGINKKQGTVQIIDTTILNADGKIPTKSIDGTDGDGNNFLMDNGEWGDPKVDIDKKLEDVIPSNMLTVYIGNDTSQRRNGYWKNNNGVAIYTETNNNYRAVNAQDIGGLYKIIVKRLRQNTDVQIDGFQSIFIVDEDYKIIESYTNPTDGYFDKEIFVPYRAKYLLLNYYIVSNDLQFDGYKYNKTVDKDGITETLFENLLKETNGNRYITFNEYEGNKWWTSDGYKIESQENQHNYVKRAVITVNQGSFYKVIYGQYQFSISNKTAMYLCDDDGNVIKTYDIYPDNIFSIPFGVTKIYINFWTSSNPPQRIIEYSNNCLLNKNVAIIGDSISTNGNTGTYANTVEMTISNEDVGKTLSAYPTMYDVNANLSLGGHTFTSAEVGEEVEFVPTSNDVGKVIGLPNNYNNNALTTWWEFAKDYFGFNPIPVCWSGSSIARHENEVANPELKCSYSWHNSQIRKCGIREVGTMNRTAPDVIIVYRGCNDMTHSPYSRLTNGYFDNPTFDYPTDDTLEDGTHGFKEAYVLLISKLRKAYPNAKIILCTLAVFKRINYSHFPTNNGLYTLPQMNNAIREIADYMGCGLIEFDKCGITFENCYNEGYITDSNTTPTHPSEKGHFMMGVKAINDLKKYC